MRVSEDTLPGWKRQGKRKRADRGGGRSSGERNWRCVEEKEKTEGTREIGGEWDEEGAKALADGGESLRRVARRSYRRYHGGSLPSRFPRLPRFSSSPLPPPFLPLPRPCRVHLRNNARYTVPRSLAPYLGYALYTIRRNNVTAGW